MLLLPQVLLLLQGIRAHPQLWQHSRLQEALRCKRQHRKQQQRQEKQQQRPLLLFCNEVTIKHS